MKLWLVRHGQTDLNRKRLMQGRSDEPLNETGIRQAQEAARLTSGVTFDAVYASPLQRAVKTASLISGWDPEKIIIDDRLIETDFGKYEKRPFRLLGPFMWLYWLLPEVFPAPPTVERIDQMTARSSSFLKELERHPAENVLVSCHGGIIRALCGYLEYRPNGILWRPKPQNCEFRIYTFEKERWTRIR